MTTPQRTNWENLINSHGKGVFTREEARTILSDEEINRLIDFGLILELGGYLEMRDGVRKAS